MGCILAWPEVREEAFAGRNLAEFEVLYLFVDGIAERLHLSQPRETVLCAWAILEDGKKLLLHLAPGSKEDTISCREFFRDLRSDSYRLCAKISRVLMPSACSLWCRSRMKSIPRNYPAKKGLDLT